MFINSSKVFILLLLGCVSIIFAFDEVYPYFFLFGKVFSNIDRRLQNLTEDEKNMARKCMETLNITSEQLETMSSATTFDEESACFVGCFMVAIGTVCQNHHTKLYLVL